jgi:pimeloyl-ACP methyl ester carboxylesterase
MRRVFLKSSRDNTKKLRFNQYLLRILRLLDNLHEISTGGFLKAQLNGSTIYYTEMGDPSSLPVIFLHGFPFDHKMWKKQLEVVGRNYRAIAFDIRGHGESEVGDGQYLIEGHVEDLMALLELLRLQRPVIVGLSMGGYIALRALEKYPDRFSAAVLCDTRSEADTNEGKLKRFAGATLVKTKGSAAFAEGFMGSLFAPESQRAVRDEKEAIRKTMEATSPLSIAGTLIALSARMDTTSSLSSIKIPTLIMVGEFDQLTPPAASEAMHERISGSELFIVPGAAHMSNLENPEFFNEKLLQFLKKVLEIEKGKSR